MIGSSWSKRKIKVLHCMLKFLSMSSYYKYPENPGGDTGTETNYLPNEELSTSIKVEIYNV